MNVLNLHPHFRYSLNITVKIKIHLFLHVIAKTFHRIVLGLCHKTAPVTTVVQLPSMSWVLHVSQEEGYNLYQGFPQVSPQAVGGISDELIVSAAHSI